MIHDALEEKTTVIFIRDAALSKHAAWKSYDQGSTAQMDI